MNKEETETFLMTGTRTGKITSVRENGSPHVAPVWFIVNTDDRGMNIIFETGEQSAKGKNMLRDPRVSFCVDDQIPPFSFVVIDGIAEIDREPDPDDLLKWATKIAERYMGRDKAEAFGKRNTGEGELLVRIRPKKIIAQKDIAG